MHLKVMHALGASRCRLHLQAQDCRAGILAEDLPGDLDMHPKIGYSKWMQTLADSTEETVGFMFAINGAAFAERSIIFRNSLVAVDTATPCVPLK